ncbi:MAG: hypothetical protein ABFD49_06000 [Armatimonadota bacterium]|nr:hypothetical protein [bacterium]
MIKLCSMRAKIVFWALGIATFFVIVVAIFSVSIGQRKTDANTTISPWDFTQAPPQSVSRNEIRVIEPKNESVKWKTDKRMAQAKTIR